MSASNRPVFTLAGFTEFQMITDPRCRLADLRAFLATYAVDLKRNNWTLHRSPVYCIAGPFQIADMKTSPNIPTVEIHPPLEVSEIDCGLAVALFGNGQPSVDDPSFRDYRWPFFVSERLDVVFVLKHLNPLDDQWWKFTFAPGKTYGDRTEPLLVGRDTPHEADQSTEAKS
jgi:hypothetical protein